MLTMTTTRSFLALLLATTHVAAQYGGGGGGGFEGFGGEAKFCKPYRCSKDQEAVPKWPLRLSSPGCSGMGGMQVFSGGSGGDDDPQTPCCDHRHACIQTCGSLKSNCDDDFIKCTKATCAAMDDEAERKKCDSSAGIHEMMMKMDQCQKYDSEQYTHCECVAKGDDANKKREKVLRAFYKKFNPDSIDKVAALAKKVDTPRKMAGLLMKLYKKYPKVIKKVKDPQQQMMEDMMKKADKKVDEEAVEEDDGSDAEDLGTDEL